MPSVVQHLQNNEWLSKALRYAKLTATKSAILVFILNFIVLIPLAMVFDAWLPTSIRRGFSTDIPSWAFAFLLQPVILSAFSWIQQAANQLFTKLINEGILQNNSYIKSELTKSQRKLQHRWLSLIVALIAVTMTVASVFALTNTIIPAPVPIWLTANPILAIVVSPSYFVTFYASLLFLYDLFVVFYTLNKIIGAQKIKVELLHPDNAGGLGSIGQFISNLGYIMAGIGGTLIVSAIYDPENLLNGRDYALAIYIGIYIFLIPFLFFRPLWSAHLAMIAYRDNVIIDLSKEFDSTYSEYLNSTSKSLERTNKLIAKLKQLEEMYILTKKFPIWPFNYDNLRKYFGLSLSPFLSIIFSVVRELVISLYT